MSTRTSGLRCFAVEPGCAQLTWSRLGPGPVKFTWPSGDLVVEADGGPGAVLIEELTAQPGLEVQVEPTRAASPSMIALELPSHPPGEELTRFATISDLHLGTQRFGMLRTITEHHTEVPHPLRCARAAIAEALEWGAQRIVVKGDLTHASYPHTWAMAAELLSDVPVPVDVICGNHDVSARSTVDPFAEAARYGLRLHRGITPIDLPGLRLVLMDSTVPGIDIGRWNHLRDDAVDAVGEARGPAMLVVHHHPQPLPVPTHLPRGIPSIAAASFLRSLRRANPELIGTSGHTHRHRFRTVAGVPWSEVGSTKDYPGTWAGYVVHEGGVRQVVRRVARADCLRWTERTKRCALGAWALWSPGRLADRCWTHTWDQPSPIDDE